MNEYDNDCEGLNYTSKLELIIFIGLTITFSGLFYLVVIFLFSLLLK